MNVNLTEQDREDLNDALSWAANAYNISVDMRDHASTPEMRKLAQALSHAAYSLQKSLLVTLGTLAH